MFAVPSRCHWIHLDCTSLAEANASSVLNGIIRRIGTSGQHKVTVDTTFLIQSVFDINSPDSSAVLIIDGEQNHRQ